jgi:hypothetical protein
MDWAHPTHPKGLTWTNSEKRFRRGGVARVRHRKRNIPHGRLGKPLQQQSANAAQSLRNCRTLTIGHSSVSPSEQASGKYSAFKLAFLEHMG